MKAPKDAAWVLSPWYGTLEIVGLPNEDGFIGSTACWDGDHVWYYPTETLRPLARTAAEILGRKPNRYRVWDDRQVAAWNSEPIQWPNGDLEMPVFRT